MPHERAGRKSMSDAFTISDLFIRDADAPRQRLNRLLLCNQALVCWSMIFSEKTGPAFRAHVLIRRHEDRKPETGEVMQRLIDADQRPEPGMFLVDAEGRGAQSLGAIDRDVNDEVDEGDEPEFRCDD